LIKVLTLAVLNLCMAINPIKMVAIPTINEVEIVESAAYNSDDLYWLSRLIYAESGSNSDELQMAIGSVVLNRVKSNLYPNTIREVIFDTNWGVQYGCTTNGMIYLEPDERAIANATYLLNWGSVIPSNVLAQCDRVVWGNHYRTIEGVVFSYYGG